jgi:hypothetical protein
MIPVEDDQQSTYHAARSALTARYGHLALKFPPAPSMRLTTSHGSH